MDYSEYIPFLTYKMIGSIPLIIVLFIGVYFCMRHARRRPQVVVLTGLALLAAGLDYFLSDPVFIILALELLEEIPLFEGFLESIIPDSFDDEEAYLFYVIIVSIPKTIIWGLLLWVIFKTYPQPMRPEITPEQSQ